MKNLKQTLAPLSYLLHKIKPALKGVILVIIGLIITRQSVGIGRLTVNLLFGIISYFLFGLAMLFIYSHIEEGELREIKVFKLKNLLKFLVFLALGLITLIFHIIINNIGYGVLIYVIITMSVWVGLAFLYSRGIKKDLTRLFIPNLIFSCGIIYGAILNTLAFPYIVVLFFLATIFLQFARDLLDYPYFSHKANQTISKPIKISLYSQLLSAVFLTMAIFFGVAYPVFYLYPLIANLIVFSFTIYCTNKLSSRKGNINRIEKLLKLLVYLELLAFVLAS
ncbi:MAG: hypothetical protein ACOC44_01110 [Promethearchaeia archaeon]